MFFFNTGMSNATHACNPGDHSPFSHFKYKRYKYSPHVVAMLQFPRAIIYRRTKDRLQVTVLARSRGTLAERL